MYDPFQEYSVKKGQFAFFKHNDWKYKQLWCKQFSAWCILTKPGRSTVNETQNGMFHLKVIAGYLIQNKST